MKLLNVLSMLLSIACEASPPDSSTKVSDMVRNDIGLTEGDVILRINDVTVRTADDVARAIGQANPRYANRAVFERRGARFYTDFFIR